MTQKTYNANNIAERIRKLLLNIDLKIAEAEGQIALAEQELSVNKGGAVTVTMMGDGSIKSIEIDDDAFEKENKEMVQDLIVMAINELDEKVEAAKEEINERITGSKGGFGAF